MAALTADVVGLIRKTILDSYKYSDGFPILKELVQNANDAEASEMSIYFSSGIPNAVLPKVNLDFFIKANKVV